MATRPGSPAMTCEKTVERAGGMLTFTGALHVEPALAPALRGSLTDIVVRCTAWSVLSDHTTYRLPARSIVIHGISSGSGLNPAPGPFVGGSASGYDFQVLAP